MYSFIALNIVNLTAEVSTGIEKFNFDYEESNAISIIIIC